MDSKVFKKLVSEIFVNMGFEKKGGSFYKRNADLIFVIGLQKSNYSNGYFFNLGYTIKELHQNIDYPKYFEADIRARFSFYSSTKEQTDLFVLNFENYQKDEEVYNYIQEQIENNLSNLIEPAEKIGLKLFLQDKPLLLLQTTIKAKNYLNLN